MLRSVKYFSTYNSHTFTGFDIDNTPVEIFDNEPPPILKDGILNIIDANFKFNTFYTSNEINMFIDLGMIENIIGWESYDKINVGDHLFIECNSVPNWKDGYYKVTKI